MSDLGKKISALPETTDLNGLFTIGTDKNTTSKKVSLQFLKEAATYANAQGDYAKSVGDTIEGNTGVNQYSTFTPFVQYEIGSIVRYNNRLYRFTSVHPAGEWVGTDVVETSIKAENEFQIEQLSDEIIGQHKEFDYTSGVALNKFVFNVKNGDVVTVSTTQDAPSGVNLRVTQGMQIVQEEKIQTAVTKKEVVINYNGTLYLYVTAANPTSLKVIIEGRSGEIEKIDSKLTELSAWRGNIFFVRNKQGYYLIDKDGYIAMLYDQHGLDAAKVSQHLIQVLEENGLANAHEVLKNSFFIGSNKKGYFVTDEDGNIGLQYTDDGLDAAKVSQHLKDMLGGFPKSEGDKISFDLSQDAYFSKGASNLREYNASLNPYGFIVAGQSNADGRIPNADFPSSCEVNGQTIELKKQLPHCLYMKGSTNESIIETTANFVERKNTGAWAFDDVLYNLIDNKINKDFYVVKQTRGATSLRYQYATSFCPDLEKFNNNPGWYSQLYHLYLSVQRAKELVPNITYKAIFWHQGEGDYTNEKDGIYYEDFIHMIQWIRGLVNDPNIPFIFGTIPPNSAQFGIHVYNDMIKAANTLDNVFLIEMPECNDWVQDGMNVHFGSADATYLATEMFNVLTTNKFI